MELVKGSIASLKIIIFASTRLVTEVITLAFFAWIVTMSSATAQSTTTTESGWSTTCFSEQLCELKNEKIRNETIAARVSILNYRGQFLLQYTIPLGVDVAQGVKISIDDGDPIATTLSNCTFNGCTGHLELAPDIIHKMIRGNKINVIFLDPVSQDMFVIDFNLVGFLEGFRNMTS